jgi:hypothetical protein
MTSFSRPSLHPESVEACRLAQNITRNCGWHVFPCKLDKKPTTCAVVEQNSPPLAVIEASEQLERKVELFIGQLWKYRWKAGR